MGWLLITPLLSVLSLQLFQVPEGTCFPEDARSDSPSGRHRVTYSWEMEMHQLYFHSGKGDPVRVLTFQRSACVHWSPGGDFFALTDHVGSNKSSVEIVSSADPAKRVRVTDLLPPAVKALVSDSLHAYVEVDSWGAAGLLVRAHGDRASDPREFDVWVRCEIEDRQWSCDDALRP